jgi:hypothetical protein
VSRRTWVDPPYSAPRLRNPVVYGAGNEIVRRARELAPANQRAQDGGDTVSPALPLERAAVDQHQARGVASDGRLSAARAGALFEAAHPSRPDLAARFARVEHSGEFGEEVEDRRGQSELLIKTNCDRIVQRLGTCGDPCVGG